MDPSPSGTAAVTTPGKNTSGLNDASAFEPRACSARWMTRNSSWISGYKRIANAPVWDASVEAYEVYEGPKLIGR